MRAPRDDPWLAVVGAVLAMLLCGAAARADNLDMLMGPGFHAESLGGNHFADRVHGGNIEGELGVHALRHRQALQQRHRGFAPPYNQRYRGAAGQRGRTPWPNADETLRGGPTWEGDKVACHPVLKVDRDDDGRRWLFSGTRCYDGYGQPHVLERSFEAREYR